MHDVFTVGVPLLAILAGILFSRSDLKELRVEIKADLKELRGEMLRRFDAVDARFQAVDARFNAVDGRFNALDAELRYFHGSNGKLEARVDAVEKRQR